MVATADFGTATLVACPTIAAVPALNPVKMPMPTMNGSAASALALRKFVVMLPPHAAMRSLAQEITTQSAGMRSEFQGLKIDLSYSGCRCVAPQQFFRLRAELLIFG